MYGRILPQFVVSAFTICVFHSAVHAQHIYWTDRTSNEIRRDSLVNDTPSEHLYTGSDPGLGIALDLNGNKMYWTEGSTIRVANLDGSDAAVYRSGLSGPWRVAVDSAAGRLYWTADEGIFRTDLGDDAAGMTLVLPFAPKPAGLALDLANGKMYFSTLGGIIYCADLDGNNVEMVVDLSFDSAPIAIALDVPGFMIYWIEGFPFPKLGSALLDGGDVDFNPAKSGFDAGDIALDLGNGKMYWTYNAAIHRANLDWTDQEVLDTPLAVQPYAIALDLRADPVAPQLRIRPGTCPNSVNVRSRGVVTMALVGGPTFDVADVDTSTLSLGRWDGLGSSVAPKTKRSSKMTITDVAGLSRAVPCDCDNVGPDDIDDLVVKFDAEDMVELLELEQEAKKASLLLTLSGQLLDGTPFDASDCIVVNGGRGGPAASQQRGAHNGRR